ncbi:anti-sigma B factor RsbW [Peribacillus huizhouensis]|uniref:Serine-protein kinase RsbW n=1 Tax=Peribacillus huizhouensis TaxID=1501239 RepID=A0ABR6CW40_9BACI|nr:anti-sigma B factor RsbW [Peribacillus huizhouensis]MBA9029236.1 serine/threonine-protein kinase RsbW [Peribacillus huizhouensis]
MSQAYEYIEMKIPAKPNFIGVIWLTLSGIASRMGFTYDEIEDLKIATSEACTNAVQHAYKGQDHGQVKISFGLYEDRLEVMVSDSGKSCNFDEVRQGLGPYKNEHEVEFLREGGLGLYLIETLMDEVKIHQHEGVTVFMTKFVEGERVEMDAKTLST